MEPYASERTALIIVDPLNDFMSPRGKLWPLVRKVSKQVNTVANMERVMGAARARGIKIAFAPHRRYVSGQFDDRKYLHPSHVGTKAFGVFAEGKFGGQFHERFTPKAEDLVASPHACSSGFAETDLHAQLGVHGITHVILIGYASNTCVEATARSAVDLDYHVTLVTDAVTSFTPEDHGAAVDLSYHRLGQQVTQTQSLVRALERGGESHA